jgi:hypothetical protein
VSWAERIFDTAKNVIRKILIADFLQKSCFAKSIIILIEDIG